MAARKGIDYGWHPPIDQARIAELKKAGITFVCRYHSHDSTKNLSRAEAHTLSGGGLEIVSVWETSAQRALGGISAGRADGKEALAQATACGMPIGRPIYFAVDFDANDAQKPIVRQYLAGAAESLGGKEHVGVYGGYWVVKDCLDHVACGFAWQTYAWSGGKRDARAQLYQYLNDVTVAGISADWDRAYQPDFGQWKIGAPPPPLATYEAYEVRGTDRKLIARAPSKRKLVARLWGTGG